MATMHLGVVDVGYTDGDKATTTGDVATFIESDYGVMKVFADLYEKEIGEWVCDALAGDIESMMQGRPTTIASKFLDTKLGDRPISGQSINGQIEEAFRDYLAMGEWERASGAIVAAAQAGITHRKKKPNAKDNSARPAFIDTGLYSAAFRAWIDA